MTILDPVRRTLDSRPGAPLHDRRHSTVPTREHEGVCGSEEVGLVMNYWLETYSWCAQNRLTTAAKQSARPRSGDNEGRAMGTLPMWARRTVQV
jgi:hypothetical protein